jgi:hypothetical protein
MHCANTDGPSLRFFAEFSFATAATRIRSETAFMLLLRPAEDEKAATRRGRCSLEQNIGTGYAGLSIKVVIISATLLRPVSHSLDRLLLTLMYP